MKNIIERKEYKEPLEKLKTLTNTGASKIIAIDGRPNAGKSTFARFLSWKLEISLIETDVFLIPNQGTLKYETSLLEDVFKNQRKWEKSIIVEGTCILDLLIELKVPYNYHLLVTSEDNCSCLEIYEKCKCILGNECNDYDEQFKPNENADLVVHLPSNTTQQP